METDVVIPTGKPEVKKNEMKKKKKRKKKRKKTLGTEEKRLCRHVTVRRRSRSSSIDTSRYFARLAHKKHRKRRNRTRRRQRKRDKKSNTSVTTKTSNSRHEKRKRAKRRRKKKMFRRRNRVRRHLPRMHRLDVKIFKSNARRNANWTDAVVLQMLRHARRRKLLMMRRVLRFKLNACAAKRRAAKVLRRADRHARHRRKKHRRYRRALKRWATKRGRVLREKATATRANVTKRVPWKRVVTERKRVPYPKWFPQKVTVWRLEPVSRTIHHKARLKIVLGDIPYTFYQPIMGDFGVISGECMFNCQTPVQLRYQTQLMDDKTGNKDAKIIVQLVRIQSQNVVRCLSFGYFSVVQWLLTTPITTTTLDDVIKANPVMPMATSVTLALQTFFCIRDLHKIGYAHLRVRPSSFCFRADKQHIAVFHDFQFAETHEQCDERNRLTMSFELKAMNAKLIKKTSLLLNKVDTYMSRRQHFRMHQGAADDFESWFYIATRMVNAEPLKWQKFENGAGDHWRMVMAKYEFPKTYTHPDAKVHARMTAILKYVMAVNDRNAEKVAYFIGKHLAAWKTSVGKMSTPVVWLEKSPRRLEQMEVMLKRGPLTQANKEKLEKLDVHPDAQYKRVKPVLCTEDEAEEEKEEKERPKEPL